MLKFLALFLLLLAPSIAQAAERGYYAPPERFNAAFQVMDGGLSSVMGFFGESTGRFAYDAEKNEVRNVKIAVDVTGLSSPSRTAGEDLKSLFSANIHKEIVFMATAPSSFKDGHGFIKGTLTIRGESKPATFEASLNRGEDSRMIGLSMKNAFKRAEFGMGDPPEVPGRFGSSVNLIFEMQAVRQ